ncbi:MAG: flap endonuclease [Gammaproteobacteria bacterium]|nr:MAG: flap endonuclease [Gammaproteobacteria bacterium]
MKLPLYLIDASIYIFRHYFVLPERWQSEEGFPTQAVYGYLGFLLSLLEQRQPEYIAAAFDESLGSCFRNQIYPPYKANRVLPDEALAFQLEACAEVTGLMGITPLASESHEADDIIGTLARRGQQHRQQIIVVSADKDLAQLLKDEDLIWDFGRSEARDRQGVMDTLGVWPEQLADYLALVGDPVDHIPGVPGIGAKTAMAMLDRFGSLDTILVAGDALAEVPVRGASKLPMKIAGCREQLTMIRQLTGIAEDAPIGEPSVRRRAVQLNELSDFCLRMGFGHNVFQRIQRLTGDTISQ